jgi:dihydrofolate reductase
VVDRPATTSLGWRSEYRLQRRGEVDVGEILVHEFMTLDGIIDAPTWTAEFGFDPEMAGPLSAATGRSAGILLGRTTYQMFEPAWSTRTVDDDPGAPFFNETTKYVVSGTLTETTWRNSEVIGAYDSDRIRALKDEVDGDLYVSGSGTLVRAMLADGLVDELHLFVYPTTRGEGPRLFTEDAGVATYELAQAEHYENGVLYVRYRPRS